MTYLHDPNRHPGPPDTWSLGRMLPRQRSAPPSAHDDLQAPEPPVPVDAGTQESDCGSFVCSDCNLGFGQHLHLHLRPAAVEVGKARAAAGAALTSWGCPPEAVDDSRLLVSELLANAVKHAPGTWITLDLMLIGDRLLVEVTDGSLARPVVHTTDHQQEEGRGMFLVQAIASAWGARRGRRGRKTTWCTLAVDGRGEPPPPY